MHYQKSHNCHIKNLTPKRDDITERLYDHLKGSIPGYKIPLPNGKI